MRLTLDFISKCPRIGKFCGVWSGCGSRCVWCEYIGRKKQPHGDIASLHFPGNIPAPPPKPSSDKQPPAAGLASGLVGYGDSDDDSGGSEGAPTPPRVDDDGDFQLEKESEGAEKVTEGTASPGIAPHVSVVSKY